MYAPVAYPVDVRTSDVGNALDVTCDVGCQNSHLSGELVRQVRQIEVVTGVQHEDQRNPDAGYPGESPVFIEPKSLVAGLA
jgi:hypothetical protein